MKSCKEIETGLYILADRQEREHIPADLLEHVQACDRCGKLYASLMEVETAIAQGGDVPLPPESYFEKLPSEILDRLPAEKSARKGFTAIPAIAAWLAGIFSRPVIKAAFAIAMFAIVAIAIWQNLPEDAQITFVDNTRKVNKIKTEAPPETEESPQALTATEPETDILAEESATIPKKEALKTAGASKPQGVAAGREMEPKPDSALSQFAQAEIKFNQGLAIRQTVPEHAVDLTLRSIPPPAVTEKLKRAEGTPKKREITALDATELNEIEKQDDDRRRKSDRFMGRTRGVSTTAPKDRLQMLGKADVAFAVYLRKAQSVASDKERVALWRRFLASTQDSTQYALGLEQLATAIKANAGQSSEVHELADAVAWFEKNTAVLEPLMGKKAFDKQLAELRARLQKARTGKLKKE